MEEQKTRKRILYKVIDTTTGETMVNNITSSDLAVLLGCSLTEASRCAREGRIFGEIYKAVRESEPEKFSARTIQNDLWSRWDRTISELKSRIIWCSEMGPGVRKINLKPNNGNK